MASTLTDLFEEGTNALRRSATAQAGIYREYGLLLERYAHRDVDTLGFAREAAALYIGGWSDAARALLETSAKFGDVVAHQVDMPKTRSGRAHKTVA